jgi:hypothetical protein
LLIGYNRGACALERRRLYTRSDGYVVGEFCRVEYHGMGLAMIIAHSISTQFLSTVLLFCFICKLRKGTILAHAAA